MGRKTTALIFYVSNKWYCTQEGMEMVKKGKSQQRNWISSDSSTKCHKDQLY